MFALRNRVINERVRRDGKYDLAELWGKIDKEFANGCTKEVQPDGSVMYVGII